MKLKPIGEQVLVITGASSGIGLATARLAVSRGAKVVLAARNKAELDQIVAEMNADKPTPVAVAVEADVADEQAVREIARAANDAFGGFETWVNNAGVSVYGKIEEVSLEDHRHIFETNFWGLVHGSRVAAEHLKGRAGPFAGSLINIGSVLSDRAIPLQGMYSASKHAVKGFTDALRMELESEDAPIFVTLIKPAAIDTPYVKHAKNYMDYEAAVPPPVYDPELVANAILHAAEHGDRDLIVGGGGAMLAKMGQIAPRLTDKLMNATMYRQQRTSRPAQRPDPHSLYEPSGEMYGRERGDHGERGGYTRETSLYTAAAKHPAVVTLVTLAVGVTVLGLLGARSREDGYDDHDYSPGGRAPAAPRRREPYLYPR